MRNGWHMLDEKHARGAQEAHLFGSYWATIDRQGDVRHGEWAWAVHDLEHDHAAVVLGYALDPHDAKRAVFDWAVAHASRADRRRLRALRRPATRG